MSAGPKPLAEMDDEELAMHRRWARTWARAGEELRQIRHAELRAMTDADMRHAVATLFAGQSPASAKARSGLVDLQRALAAGR